MIRGDIREHWQRELVTLPHCEFTVDELREASDRLRKEKKLEYLTSLQEHVKKQLAKNPQTNIVIAEKIVEAANDLLKGTEIAFREKNASADIEKFDRILVLTARCAGIKVSYIQLHRRFETITKARFVVIFCTRWLTPLSLNKIGELTIPKRPLDHSTCISACKSITDILSQSREIPSKLFDLLQKTMSVLAAEGLLIDLYKDQPKWYMDLIGAEIAQDIVQEEIIRRRPRITAKISATKAQEIKNLRKTMYLKDLAKLYTISISYVSQICNNKKQF